MKPGTKRKRETNALIPCGWKGCKLQCADDWQLNTHLGEHIAQQLPKCENNLYDCPMVKCAFQTECQRELQRHIYFHGYFAGLVVQGKLVLEANPQIPKCSATARTGHKVPDLKNDFRCEWADCDRTFISVVEFQDHIVQHASFEYEIQKTPGEYYLVLFNMK